MHDETTVRVEMMHARRENAAFAQMVETGKKLDRIEARRKRKLGATTGDGEAGGDGNEEDGKSRRRRKHRQTKPLTDGSDVSANKALLGGLV